MTHHTLDVHPVPKDKMPLYVNEQWLIDKTFEIIDKNYTPDQKDNVRIYVPLDLNKEAILRRLDHVIANYGEANEGNEMDFQIDVEMLIYQLEIYDQVHYVRHMPKEGEHSLEGIALAEEL